MTRAGLLRAYRAHYNPSLARMFAASGTPVEASGHASKVRDSDGREYLDFAAGHGVFAVGYSNPHIREAVLAQLEQLATAPPLLGNAPAAAFMSRLTALLPPGLDRVSLAGSGSEAVETALRTARLARPHRRRLVAALDSYHGKTLGALGVMGQPHLRTPFGGKWPDTTFVPHGDIDALARAVGSGALAVILEPILGGGSLSVPPDGYLAAARELCDRTGTLLIADEVQTGFGRTGTMFAIEREGVVPDMVILSKAITGGHVPIAATVVRGALFEGAPDPGALARGSDSSGSPLVCAAANATLDYITEHDLPARAAALGEPLLAGLTSIAADHAPLVLSARGRGLMTGLELRNRMVENALWLKLLKRGVIGCLSLSNAARPVMRVLPPLTVERAEIDYALEALDDSMRELRRGIRPHLYDLGEHSLRFQHRMPASVLRGGARLIG
jgi:putrescine aminotransferase